MKFQFVSAFRVLVFQLLSLSLVFGIVINRADIVIAQADTDDSDSPILTPRETQVEDDADMDDDDDDDDDPEILSYVVQPGDNLWRIAARLGLPYQVLAAQTDSPRRIFAGQVFTYSSLDLQGEQTASGLSVTSVTVSQSGGSSYTFTVRPGDTLSHIALWLGIPLEELKEQVDNPSRIMPGQRISYVSDRRIDTPPLLTDNDGTDSDGIATSQLTDNDGTDSDGYDTTGNLTDNDGTDSDGIDTTGLQDDSDNDADDSDDSDSDDSGDSDSD